MIFIAEIADIGGSIPPRLRQPKRGLGQRAAVMYTLIQTAKLNHVDPQAWLRDVLARIADHKSNDLAALLPWNWRRPTPINAAA